MNSSILKKWQVIFWGVCVFISLLLISNVIPVNKGKGIGFGKGLDYGLDFAGGIQLQMQLEKPVDADTMAVERGILENRLNSMGLKDIPVRSWGDQYMLIQVAGASPDEIVGIENILNQQARFEERISGDLAVKGSEITVDLSPGATRLYNAPSGYTWEVPVKHDSDGACRFGKVGDGKKGLPVDIFVDRPENTTILMPSGLYALFQNFTSTGTGDILYGDSLIYVIENRSRIPVVAMTDLNSSLKELAALKAQGYNMVLLAGGEDQISEGVRNRVEEAGFKTQRKSLGSNESYIGWVMELTGIKSSPRLNFETRGECVYSALITGGALTLEEAKGRVKENQVLLTSGNLPAKATIESKSTTPPALGMKFLDYSFFIGLLALLTVGLIVFLRYRRLDISIPIMLTDISEVLIVMGLAAMIHWNLDLPSIAGILGAVGTGVNDQIIITDEAMLGRHRKEKKDALFFNVSDQIKRAFFIIFTAAATIIAAMLPILGIGAGMLKGFAFTTIMGVLVGVFITRQGYAAVVREILKK